MSDLPEVFCNTSPLQYLHQLGLLDILPKMVGRVVVPPAVIQELAAGRENGYAVPDVTNLAWVEVRVPTGLQDLELVTNLGAGEKEVLALALEARGGIVILDDGRARRLARSLGIPLSGTLRLLLDGKTAGLVDRIAPVLERRLEHLGFHLDRATYRAVLDFAGESP